MSRDDVALDGALPAANVGRARRPALERTEPRRGWGNLYAPGKADNAARPPDTEGASTAASPVEPEPAPTDAAARVIRDGYRIVEENLRRGQRVAAELRGARREGAGASAPSEAHRVVSDFTQALFDPALTEQLVGVARSLLNAVGIATPPAPVDVKAKDADAHVPLHPQQRSDFSASGARVLKLRRVSADEWLADLELDGEVRRVQIRAVDGEL
jgi:hypothetical protein